MGAVGAVRTSIANRPRYTAAIAILVILVIAGLAGASVGLYFALRPAGAAQAAMYKLVSPPDPIAGLDGAILMPMIEAATTATARVVWWAYEEAGPPRVSIGLVPTPTGAWSLVQFETGACHVWASSASSATGATDPPVPGVWKFGETALPFKLEKGASVASASKPRPVGACLLRVSPAPAPNVYPLELEVASAAPHVPQLSGATSTNLVLLPMRDPSASAGNAMWYRVTSPAPAFASIAIVPGFEVGETSKPLWRLVALNARSTCTTYAVAERAATDFGPDRPGTQSGNVWYAGGTLRGVAIGIRISRLTNSATPTSGALPSVCEPLAPSRPRIAATLTLRSTIPILASFASSPQSGSQVLSPYYSDSDASIVRWASSASASGARIYVIDLVREAAFGVGIQGLARAAYWGLFIHTPRSGYRGLAYSTLVPIQGQGLATPPPSTTDSAWVSSWTTPAAVVLPIKVELLKLVTAGDAPITLTVFPSGRVNWTAPIRFPDPTRTTVGGTKLTLDTYDWHVFLGQKQGEPDETLRTKKYEGPHTDNYKPEFAGSSVQWWYKGMASTESVPMVPDVCVRQYSQSALEDEPELGALVPQQAASATWIVYSRSPLREPVQGGSGAPYTLALLAWTKVASDGVPPSGTVWVCLERGPPGAYLREILFSLRRVETPTELPSLKAS